MCVSVCSNWLDLEPAANESGIFVGARPTFERCGFEVRVGGGDACVVLVLCVGNPKVPNKRRVRCLVGSQSPQKRPLFLGIWKIMDKIRVFIPGFVLVLLCYCLIDEVSIIFVFTPGKPN